MAAKRGSPTEADIQRVAETIKTLDTFGEIDDYDSFNNAFEDYFKDDKLGRDRDFENDVFDTLISRYEDIEDTRGEKRKHIQEHRKKNRYAGIKEMVMIKEGIPLIIKKRVLDTPSYTRGRITYSEKTSVIIKGKKFERLRNAKGQFASKKRKG